MEEAVYVLEQGIWGISIAFSQFYFKPKTALKKSLKKKVNM